jgi:hypothetical protein
MLKRELTVDPRSRCFSHRPSLLVVLIAPQDRFRQGVHIARRNYPPFFAFRHAIV